ncbi:MAG: S-layer protein [Methanomicrobiales archaeon]|nr:S-layer protein [Methanomicrobiales archaeon]
MKLVGRKINAMLRFSGLLVALIVISSVVPASAGTVYLSGGPDMNAAISGTNEFSPGTTVTIPIMVENRGLIDMKIIRPELVSRDDLPNTAKMVRLSLLSGDAPVTVKSDPQMVGDIAGGSSRSVAFSLLVAKDAVAGRYALPLRIEYTYLDSAESEGQDNIRYYYRTVTKTVNLSINIKSVARLGVLGAETEHLNVGTEGYLVLKLRNTGNEPISKGVLLVSRHPSSPVIPVESSVFLGEVPAGSEMGVKVKLSVAKTAEGGQTYPLDLSISYENSDGILSVTDTVTIGVPVAGKVDFAVVSAPITMLKGEKSVIEVEFRNTGTAMVFNALARISAVEPFTSGDDTSFLGDMAPGDTKVARFEVSVDSDATPKEYGMDTEIRYRDALDNTLISDTMKVRIDVKEREGMGAFLSNPIYVSLIVVVLIAAAYLVLRRRKA